MNIWFKHKFEIILILVSLASTLLFASHYLFTWDSGQFALGVKNFDINSFQPHPPGYPLFLFFAWLFNFVFRDLNFSFVFINAIVGAISSVLMYKIIKGLHYDNKVAFATSLLLVFHPIFWHYRTLALSYGFEILAPLLGLFFIQKTYNNNKEKYFYTHAFCAALLIGFRPSVMIIVLPLLIINWLLLKRKIKPALWGGIIFLVSASLWFLPLMNLSDGIANYFTLLKTQYNNITKTYSEKKLIIFYFKSLLMIIGLFILPLFLAKPFKKDNKFLFYIIISLIIGIIIFYFFSHFSILGYILALVPLILLLSLNFFENIFKYSWAWIVIVLIILAETYFFQVPNKFLANSTLAAINQSTVREHDARLKTYLYISELQKAEDTLLITLRGEYYDQDKNIKRYKYDDIKVLASYLPQYKIYDLWGVKNVYFIADNYHYQQINAKEIQFANSIKKIIILGDYLHASNIPKEINLEAHCPDACIENYYQADISEIDYFHFYGFDFVRAK
jgi:hypothetical protein